MKKEIFSDVDTERVPLARIVKAQLKVHSVLMLFFGTSVRLAIGLFNSLVEESYFCGLILDVKEMDGVVL